MAIVRTLLAVLQVHVLIEESASCWLQNPSQWEALPPKAVSMASKAHPSLKTRGFSDWCFSVRSPQWFPRPPSTLWQLILFHLPSLLLPFTPGQALHGTWCISQPSLAPSPYSLPGISLANICIVNLLPCITQTNLVQFSSVQFSSVSQSCLTLCDPMDCSMSGPPVHHKLLKFTQIHVHQVCDAIQPSQPIIPFSSCLQSFPASGSFQMSQFFASGGQSIGVSASTSDLPMNIQDWFPLGWADWISLQSKGLSRLFSNTTVQKHQFFGTQLSV